MNLQMAFLCPKSGHGVIVVSFFAEVKPK